MAPTGGTSGVGPKTGAALRDAAARGDVQRVGAMLQSCAAVINETDENGCTALQRAAADGHSEVVRLLMQNGADPNRQDSMHGNTALHEAAWKGYSRCVTLLSTRAALHIRNNGGFAPLHLACQNGHNQTCREILLAGCDPDIQNNYGDTSLHTSARYGHAGVTRILISAECHVSDQNKNGDTALHIAAAMGRRKLTRILLEAGCNKGLKNKQNETAKDIAIRKELHEIVDILTTSVVKAKKESKKKDKLRDKSIERVVDTTDNVLESIVKKKGKDVSQSPGKCKDKKKVRSVHFEANGKHWSPYGCHYYPDPSNFPKPKLDSLPKEPLKKGEQYYLDLAGNICKGPVGVGYTCYCAPFFKHMEDKLNRDKLELKYHIDKAHEKLDQKVSNLERKTQGQISELTRCVAAERVLCRERQQHLEHWLTRGMMFRVSERAKKLDFSPKGSVDIAPLKRTRSLEMLDNKSKTWNIINNFNSKVRDAPARANFNRSMRNASKSADVLDTNSPRVSRKFNKSNNLSESSHNKSYRASSKSSDRSISISSYGGDHLRGGSKSDSVHNVTAEIHAKSDCDSMQRLNNSKSDELKETKVVEEKMAQVNNCLEGIENDGYIKISRCDGIENGSRRSVHELVARIQQKQIIEEIERTSVRDSRSPGGRSSGSVSRSMSPSYRMNPSQSDWQNNTIPLSENTHFNTIEPISQSVQSSSKQVQNTKSSKKFSFHNLIPFPTRKMFNFHNKSDGNRSESSDEEDNPVRTPLESGLMQNSNLLTTVPLPNYENMNQNAQPQSPNKMDANGKINPIALRSLLPIPKDAYFHDMPNKQRFLESQMFNRLPNQNVHPHFKTPDMSKSSDNINYSRNRNPVYSSNGLLSEMMHDHIDRELSRTPHSYTSQLDQNAEIEISNINNCSGYHNNMRPLSNYQSHGHLINEVINYPHDSHHLQNRMQNLAINTQLTELQSQLDRDSHNDSGYSTKVYGSSQGASPSLSGNIDCSESTLNQKLALVMNRNIITNTGSHPPHTHIGASSLV